MTEPLSPETRAALEAEYEAALAESNAYLDWSHANPSSTVEEARARMDRSMELIEAFAEPSRRLESDDRLRRDLAQDARISEEPALQILAEELAAPCEPESDYPRCLSTDWRVNFEIAEDLLKRLSAAGFVVRNYRQR